MTITGNIREEFIVEKQGKKFVLAPGLVDAAHRAFTSLSIVSTLIQYGSEENGQTWIASTKVECDNGTYVQLGDASPRNTSSQMVGVLPRLAETRSVSRALRLAVNAGVLAIFDDPDDAPEDARPVPRPAPPAEPAKPLSRAEPTLAPGPGAPRAGPSTMPATHATQQQVETIYKIGLEKHNLDRRAIDADCALRFGGLKPAELSVDQAGQYIRMVQRKELSQ